jgi:hypothetical protein
MTVNPFVKDVPAELLPQLKELYAPEMSEFLESQENGGGFENLSFVATKI